MKRKIIKTSKSDFFTNIINNSFDIQNNKLNKKIIIIILLVQL